MVMNYVNTVLVSNNIKIASEQEKRIRNALCMRASVFLKKNEMIDYNVYSLFRIYNKETRKTYTVEIEKPIEDEEPSMIWASCDCPDFMERITDNAWNIPCKHIYKSFFSLKNDSYIDLVNRSLSMPSQKKTLKIDYMDLSCPNCNARAVVEYSKICDILLQEDQVENAKYICENCYYAW